MQFVFKLNGLSIGKHHTTTETSRTIYVHIRTYHEESPCESRAWHMDVSRRPRGVCEREVNPFGRVSLVLLSVLSQFFLVMHARNVNVDDR